MRHLTSKSLLSAAILSLLALTITSCSGGGSSGNNTGNSVDTGVAATHTYFKTTVGTSSTYSDGSSSTISANSNNKITLDEVNSGIKSQTTLVVTGNSVAVESSREYNDAGTVTGEVTFSPAWKIFPAATTVGTIENQNITITPSGGTASTTKCTLTVLAQETVSVASGSSYQNTLKIQNSCVNGMGNSITWFAPGIGPVQTQNLTNNSVAQLTSSATTPPNPNPNPAPGTGGAATHTYFKTEVGSVSNYTDGSSSTVKSNSNSRVTVEQVENGATTQNTYVVTGNSVAVESSRDYDASGKLTGTTTFTPALKIFPAATTTGTVETQTVAVVTPSGSGSATCKLTVLGPEAVTTAVATYQNALKIQNTCNNGAVDSYNWFAAGAGQIKSEDLTTGAVVQLTTQSTPTTTTPPATGGIIPAELVGTWGNSSQTYTFFADGTFTFVSLYWPDGYCIVIYKMETLKDGTASVSGSNITLNTTGGQWKKWNCSMPVDGSPNSISPISPFSQTDTWSISGNQLTLSDGTANGTFTYTKQ